MGCDGALDDPPYSVAELDALEILGQIVQPPQQTERIPYCRKGCVAKAGRHPEPGLAAHLDDDPVLVPANIDGQRCLSSGHGPSAGRNLDGGVVMPAHYLGL